MRVREWVGLQKEMVQEVSGLLSLGLLAFNLGISVFILIKDTGWFGGHAGNAYVVVPVVVIVLGSLVWAMAYSWHFFGRMHFAKQRALATLNPYMTSEFTPREWVMWHDVHLPHLRALLAMNRELGLDTKELEGAIASMERWLRDGRISKAEFPEELRRFLRAT